MVNLKKESKLEAAEVLFPTGLEVAIKVSITIYLQGLRFSNIFFATKKGHQARCCNFW